MYSRLFPKKLQRIMERPRMYRPVTITFKVHPEEYRRYIRRGIHHGKHLPLQFTAFLAMILEVNEIRWSHLCDEELIALIRQEYPEKVGFTQRALNYWRGKYNRGELYPMWFPLHQSFRYNVNGDRLTTYGGTLLTSAQEKVEREKFARRRNKHYAYIASLSREIDATIDYHI